MANEDTASVSETQDWERRNTDPTIPFDGAAEENIPGPASNVEVEIAAGKRADAYGKLSTKFRPEHAKQRAESGDAVTDSDVNAAPSAGLNVAEDNGADERQAIRDERLSTDDAPSGATGVQGRTSTPPRKATTSQADKNKA